MWEVCPQVKSQLVDKDCAAEYEGQRSFGIAVDAPACIGPEAVARARLFTIDNIAGCEGRLPTRFRARINVRKQRGVLMIVKRVERQIRANSNFTGKCAARGDPVKIAAERLRRIGFAFRRGRNGQGEFISVQENQRRLHAGVERKPDMTGL